MKSSRDPATHCSPAARHAIRHTAYIYTQGVKRRHIASFVPYVLCRPFSRYDVTGASSEKCLCYCDIAFSVNSYRSYAQETNLHHLTSRNTTRAPQHRDRNARPQITVTSLHPTAQTYFKFSSQAWRRHQSNDNSAILKPSLMARR